VQTSIVVSCTYKVNGVTCDNRKFLYVRAGVNVQADVTCVRIACKIPVQLPTEMYDFEKYS